MKCVISANQVMDKFESVFEAWPAVQVSLAKLVFFKVSSDLLTQYQLLG